MNTFLLDLKIEISQDELRQVRRKAKEMVELRQEQCDHSVLLEAYEMRHGAMHRMRACVRCGKWATDPAHKNWYGFGDRYTLIRGSSIDDAVNMRNRLTYS